MYKDATRDGGYTDLEAADLSVEATVQRVRVVVVFKFLNRVKVRLSVWYEQKGINLQVQ